METRDHPHGYFRLLIALSVLGIVFPLIEIGRIGLIFWTAAFCGVIYVARCSAELSRVWVIIARVLMFAAIATGVLALWVQSTEMESAWTPVVQIAWRIFSLMFLVLATAAISRSVLTAGVVDTNKIWGAVCVYILMALCWAFALAVLEGFAPGSLVVARSGLPVEGGTAVSMLLYYSFVTLTTLGNGDIIPGNDVSRLMAGAEALTGQLYLTVVVARLVGLHITHNRLVGMDDQAES